MKDKSRQRNGERRMPSATQTPRSRHRPLQDGELRQVQPRPRGCRLWFYRFFAVTVIPLLMLICLETGLRAFGYGVPTGLTVRQKVNGQESILNNPYFTWKYFSPLMARHPDPFILPAGRRPPTTFRIVLLGGSAARGIPWPDFSIARVLEVMLAEQYPGIRFEVINTATVAINSHVVYDMVRASVRELEPDLFLVYMGNNEVVGPYGAGSSFTSSTPSTHMVRLVTYLRSLRVGQWIRQMKRHRCLRGSNPRWQGPEMFLDHKIRADDPELDRTYESFADNVNGICRASRKTGIPVILSTVGVNLRDCPPFASLHRDGISPTLRDEWERRYRKAGELQDRESHHLALEHLSAAEAIDSVYAELHYRKGRSYESLGDLANAEGAYARARDLDALRLRADSVINRIIRDTANRIPGNGVYVVDAEEALSAESPNGIAGKDLFYEYVHMTIAGNYVVARVFYDAINRLLPARVMRHATGREVLSLDACKQHLAYTDYSRSMLAEEMLRFLGRPPFTFQLHNDRRRQRFRDQVLEVARIRNRQSYDLISRQYEDRLAYTAARRGEADWLILLNYGLFLRYFSPADPHAEEQLRDALEQVPQSDDVIRALIESLLSQGKYGEADACYRDRLAFFHQSPYFEYQVGNLYAAAKEHTRAAAHYQKAIDLEPCWGEAHYLLAGALMKGEHLSPGARERALRHLEKALAINPENKHVRRQLRELSEMGSR